MLTKLYSRQRNVTFLLHWNLFWLPMTSLTESFIRPTLLHENEQNEREIIQLRLLASFATSRKNRQMLSFCIKLSIWSQLFWIWNEHRHTINRRLKIYRYKQLAGKKGWGGERASCYITGVCNAICKSNILQLML